MKTMYIISSMIRHHYVQEHTEFEHNQSGNQDTGLATCQSLGHLLLGKLQSLSCCHGDANHTLNQLFIVS